MADLVIYSAAERRYCGPLLEAFAARHPDIAVDFVDGISTALHQRFLDRRAAGTPEVDVLWSSAMDLQVGIAAAEGLTIHTTTLEPLVTLVRQDALVPDQPIGSLEEIARAIERDPGKFNGRVAGYDIEANDLGFLALMAESRNPARFERFLQRFSGSAPQLYGSNPTLIDSLVSGRAIVAPHVLAAYALRAVEANPSLAIAPTEAPCLAVSRLALIPGDAPHPKAAQAFVDFMIGVNGQEALGRAGIFPARGGKLPAALGAITLAPIEAENSLIDPVRREALLSRWRTAVGRH